MLTSGDNTVWPQSVSKVSLKSIRCDQILLLLLPWSAKQQVKLTCLFQDLLDNSKQNNLSLLTRRNHVAIRRLLMQAWRETCTVAESIALRDALLKVQGVLRKELQHQKWSRSGIE